MGLMRLSYFSTCNIDLAKISIERQLTDILDKSRRNNSSGGITGALIFEGSWFVQILEGEREAVWSRFKKIEKDDRHTRVTPIEMVAAPDRCFGNWWMTIIGRSAENSSQFAPYLFEDVFDPPKMLPEQILTLMINLTCKSPERELGIAGIGMAAQLIRERSNLQKKSASNRR